MLAATYVARRTRIVPDHAPMKASATDAASTSAAAKHHNHSAGTAGQPRKRQH